MAERLHVSRTPIHAALNYLAEAGIVEYRKNTGFFLTIGAREAEQQFYNEIDSKVAYLKFAQDALAWGDGHAINVAGLSRLYDISRYAAEQLIEVAARKDGYSARPDIIGSSSSG